MNRFSRPTRVDPAPPVVRCTLPWARQADVAACRTPPAAEGPQKHCRGPGLGRHRARPRRSAGAPAESTLRARARRFAGSVPVLVDAVTSLDLCSLAVRRGGPAAERAAAGTTQPPGTTQPALRKPCGSRRPRSVAAEVRWAPPAEVHAVPSEQARGWAAPRGTPANVPSDLSLQASHARSSLRERRVTDTGGPHVRVRRRSALETPRATPRTCRPKLSGDRARRARRAARPGGSRAAPRRARRRSRGRRNA